MPRAATPLEERIITKVEATPFGCWEWMASRDRDGYGIIKVNGSPRAAHRIAYTTLVGSIDPLMQLDHLCRNRACVNPDHLEAVTTQINTARGIKPNRGTCNNGHPRTAGNVHTTPQGHKTCRPCRLAAHARYNARRAA